MNQVWLFFCLLNLLADSACLLIHIMGSLYFQEPLPHNMVFCGTFAGFIMVSLLRTARILLGLKTRLHPQLAIDCCGMTMHFLCALLSLHYAENDFHLIFMGPQQELDHTFFGHCKQQSIACIIAGGLYLVQFVLDLDFVNKTPLFEDDKPIRIITEPPEWNEDYQYMSTEEHDRLARTQANVYLFGRHFDHWLRVKSKWFRQLAGGQELNNKADFLSLRKKRSTSRGKSITLNEDEDEESIASKKYSRRESRKTQFAEANTESSTSTDTSNQSVRR